ncbi:hypothetical protein AB0C33_01895 [Nonomuraea sp. NPDC048881]|uniref:hypothetical protein n=1 Tax=Nonomuraea sp. NPDC048881 TaxID=3155030 RepID=UPI0033C444A0
MRTMLTVQEPWLVEAELLGAQLKSLDYGFHVKELEPGRCVHVMRMLFNWRIVEWHGVCDSVLGHGGKYWCYQGIGLQSFLLAVGQAVQWDGTDDSMPAHWIRNYRGEYGADALG